MESLFYPKGIQLPDAKSLLLISALTCLSSSQLSQVEAAGQQPLLTIDSQDSSDIVWKFEFLETTGELIAVGGDKAVRFWDLESGTLRRTLRYHIGSDFEGYNYSLGISAHEEWMALGGLYAERGLSEQSNLVGGEIRIISIASGEIIGMLRGHRSAVGQLAVSEDGNWLCSSDASGEIRLWNLSEKPFSSENTAVSRLTGSTIIADLDDQVPLCKLSSDALTLVTMTEGGKVHVWNRSDEASPFIQAHEIIDDTNQITAADFSTDGRWIVTGHLRDEASVWDAKTGKVHLKLRDSTAGQVSVVSISPDSESVFFSAERNDGSGRPELLFFSLENGKQFGSISREKGNVTRACWIPTKNSFAFFDNVGKEIGVHNYTGTPAAGDWNSTNRYQIAANRHRFLSAGFSVENEVRVAFGHENAQSPTEWEPFNHVFDFSKFELRDFSSEEDDNSFRRIIDAAGDSKISYEESEIRVSGWDTSGVQGNVVSPLYTATLTDKGDKLIVGYAHDLKEFTLTDGETYYTRAFRGHNNRVRALSPSPDGRYFASASDDGTLRLWDLGPKKELNIVAVGIGLNDTDSDVAGTLTVDSVAAGLPAEKAGIMAGDIILKVDGIAYETSIELIDHTRSKSSGDRIVYLVERDGKEMEFPLKLSSFNVEDAYPSPLASLFVSNEGEWVCWLPSGHYHASPGGEKYIGWQLNKGRDKLAEFYPSYVFRDQFHDPELVKRTVLLGDFEKAKAEVRPDDVEITSILPPGVEWKTPEELNIETESDTLTISATIDSPDAELEEVKLLVNGKAVKTEYQASGNSMDYQHKIVLLPGENHLSLFVRNAHSGQLSDSRVITRLVPGKPNSSATAPELNDMLKPNLYVLAVGVSDYEDESIPSLTYCDEDASAIATLFEKQSGGIFGETEVKLLVNEEATEDGIQDALDWLEETTTQKDFVVLFLAAHGVNDEKGNFYLLPSDANPERLRSSGVAWDDFGDILGNLPSRVLMFLDTCHSGQLGANLFTLANVEGMKSRSVGGLKSAFDPSEAIRELTSDENGVVIMAASTGDESSVESETWGHGAFTKGILEGLAGEADVNKDNVIHLRELDFFVSDRVKELTEGLQHPTTVKPSTISRLPVAGVR